MYHRLLTALFTLVIAIPALYAQDCSGAEIEVIVRIIPDNYPEETSWALEDASGNLLASGEVEGDTVCVDSSLCLVFTIFDSYGDGICCEWGSGSYLIYYDGILTASGGEFGEAESVSFNCPPGYSCVDAVEIEPGLYEAEYNNYWYAFTPATTGIYTMTTCEHSDCDTRIWLYDNCSGINVSDDNTGTIYYDDNEGGCGEQAEVTAYLEADVEYFIRIGSAMEDCTGTIPWELIFGGEIEGCMDTTSCNYNPLATIDDGSCLPIGHEDCGGGPDLWVLESAIYNSLRADVVNSTDNCLIDEGCIRGFGLRQVVRFTTHIKNIGDLDYYIGAPDDQPDQFSYDNCHGHYHYEGYAEYRLYNSDHELQPVGFKNGFCVIDLECNDGGTPQYGCSNMGISSLCGDYYSYSLQCQWVDVTDLPEGDYTFVTTVNWDQSRDALGHNELRYDNNWAQVCFNLSRNGNTHEVTILEDCPDVTDCEGTPFGNVVEDCAGICGGSNLYGDVNADFQQNTADAEMYIYDIIHGGLDAQPCYDVYDDDVITVFDAALINDCFLYGSTHQHPGGGNVHDHCNLPGGVVNPTHTATLSIIDYDPTNNTVDIGLSNPQDHINAYEFNMSGMEIVSVISLVDPAVFPEEPHYLEGSNKVIGISLTDSIIPKTNGAFQPLCRIQFIPDGSGMVCIDEIIDLVNEDNHKIVGEIQDGCTDIISGISDHAANHNIDVFPNPGTGKFNLKYRLVESDVITVTILDQLGRVVRKDELGSTLQGNHVIDLTGSPDGIYSITFGGGSGVSTSRVLKAD